MFGRRTATAADDPGARIQGQACVFGHQLRRSVEANHAVDELWNAAVRLGDEHGVGVRGRREIDDRGDEFGGADAAIAAAGREVVLVAQPRQFRRSHAHHRPAVGVEAQRGNDRQAGAPGAADRGLRLDDRRHRFDPENIRTAARERLGLLGERFSRRLRRERAQRLENFAGRTHAPGNEYGAPGAVRCAAR